MFTNWLTGTSSSSASSTSAPARVHGTEAPNGLSALVNVNGLTNLNNNMISTPPDVILEVGPGPQTIRFMAHSIVLGMHSGYLRSAIRMDERINGSDLIVYLSNVTAEQFAPLLSYMYTGYLELNVENIFGVLLATHVLHMPRALEICRSYLARGQAEGFFASHTNSSILPNSINTSNSNNCHSLSVNSGKIIRPIASKPQMPNFGFLPITHTMTVPPLTDSRNAPTATINSVKRSPSYKTESIKDDDDDDIEVDEIEKQSVNSDVKQTNVNDEDDEDVEVFIDTNSEAEVVVETEIRKFSLKKSNETNRNNSKETSSSHAKSKHDKSHKKSSHRSERQRRRGGPTTATSSGLQVAKAPIPASQLDTSEANKVIIDVASCDGPVRFKRILNTAYGHKPEGCSTSNTIGSGSAVQERSLQSVSLSFHQQMAKTISQQQQVLHNGEESENSETSTGSAGGGTATGGKNSRKMQNEVFVCVYCKHTFKSQYCYQKHAKRHLNPLTLQATCVPSDKRTNPEDKKPSISQDMPGTSKSQSLQNARPFFIRNSNNQMQTNQMGSSAALHNSSDFLRREVRPLDMNVQYYPCKTCGCKFPSYYFVHKHRKMCHADEEAQQAQQGAATTSTATPGTSSNDGQVVDAVYVDNKGDDEKV